VEIPPVQYARTSDGVSIAFTTVGSGPPLIIPTPGNGHVQLDWENLPAEYFRGLAKGHTVVRFDRRGTGMSQRDAIDFSDEAGFREVEAITERLGMERFAVFGNLPGAAPLPLSLAAAWPDRVTHLVLWMSNAGRATSEAMRSTLDQLLEVDWPAYTQAWAVLTAGWEQGASLSELMQACHSPESWAAWRDYRAAVGSSWATELPGRIQVPTLILHGLGDGRTASDARSIAARMTSARVLSIPGGETRLPNALGVAAILDFLSSQPKAGSAVAEPRIDTSSVRTILFTDLVDHTAMMQRLGDARGRDVLREHERITREALKAHGGTEVKTIGDSFMASFPSAQKAVECAIALQRSFEAHRAEAAEPITLRIGLNAGEPITDEDDLFGSSVILAARTKEKAAGGEILVTEVVRHLVTGKGFLFADRGHIEMKGFEEPVRVYEVRWREEGS
jgi:class 3 adenylate cyclase